MDESSESISLVTRLFYIGISTSIAFLGAISWLVMNKLWDEGQSIIKLETLITQMLSVQEKLEVHLSQTITDYEAEAISVEVVKNQISVNKSDIAGLSERITENHREELNDLTNMRSDLNEMEKVIAPLDTHRAH